MSQPPTDLTISPATPNAVEFNSPNRMYYVSAPGRLLALCMSREIAEQIRAALEHRCDVPDSIKDAPQ